MLLRFSVENYRSIAQREELSLVATKLKGPSEGLTELSNPTGLSALPSAVIYGANASGKTNFVRAYTFMRSAILFSHRKGNPAGGVPRPAFALDLDIEASPTSVEADFIVDNVRYQYGFECNSDCFLSEWLVSFPEGKRRKLFQRDKQSVEFGPHLRGQKRALVEFMRPNSLFISTATQNDHEELSKIVAFFRSSHFSDNLSVAENLINNTFKDKEIDPRTIIFLKSLGTGIVNYRQKNTDIPEKLISFSKDLQVLIKKHSDDTVSIESDLPEHNKDISIELAHTRSDGEECFFGIEKESSGTRRLLLIMNSVFKALDSGSLIIIDELDASLHTLAAEQIIFLFSDKEINKNNAQLIATTHDTNLLSSDFLRRDQVWFCEKDNGGASHIFPLSDIKSRPTDNFERAYLEGRYGAIPFSGNLQSLFKEFR